MVDKPDKLLGLLDELAELVELHPRNNLNLCLCGGMPTLLEIICTNPNSEARGMAAAVITASLQNNKEVQEIASKYGVLNLMH